MQGALNDMYSLNFHVHLFVSINMIGIDDFLIILILISPINIVLFWHPFHTDYLR